MIINEKLFAHINNDAFLTGSHELQGNLFKHTIEYLNQFIAQLDQHNLPPAVIQLQQACQQLVAYEQAIRRLGEGTPSPEALTQLAQRIYSDIRKLKPGEYLLVPGGWETASGGHAMMYQFGLDASGDLKLSIHNSGSGLEFHPKRSDQEKELYNPTLIYHIPKVKIEEARHFSDIIENLIRPQVFSLHRRQNIDASYLYQDVFSQLSFLDAQITLDESTVPQDWCTAGQLSGTCTQRSLHQMLKSRFANLDDYRRFIYTFKAHALNDYIAYLKHAHQFGRTQYHGQIQKAIRHQLRLLNLKSTQRQSDDLFALNMKKSEIARLTQYLSELRQEHQSNQALSVRKDTIQPCELNIKAPRIVPFFPRWETHSRTDLQEPTKIQGGDQLLTDMEDLLRRCQRLQDSKQYQVLYEQLERFFLELPIPKELNARRLSYYSAIDSNDKAFDFFKKMNQLQTLYFASVNQLLNQITTLPRIYLTKLSIFTVIGHINQHIKSTFSIQCYHDLISAELRSLAGDCQDDAYLATHDPEMNARLLTIKQLYRLSGVSIDREKLYQYYLSIVDKFPSLKATLDGRYQQIYHTNHSNFHNALREHQHTTVFYFTEHRQEFANNKDFKPLCEIFNLQEEMEKSYAFFCKRTILNAFSKENTNSSTKIVSLGINYLEAKSPFTENWNAFVVGSHIKQAKFNLSKTNAALALSRDLPVIDKNPYIMPTILAKRTDNHTQIIPAEFAHMKRPLAEYGGLSKEEKHQIANRVIQESDLEDRELFHLRRNSNIQIPLTLDYFTKHLEKLTRRDMQVYLEANLFQPGLLSQQLTPEKQRDFFKQFENFIERGIQQFELKNQPSLNSISFVRLAYLVYQYAAKLNPELFRSQLEKFYQHLNVLLSLTTEPSIKASLHQYRMLTMIAAYQYPHPTVDLMEGLHSFLFIQAHENHGEQLDTASKFDIQQAQLKLKRILYQQQSAINPQQLLPVLVDLGIPIDIHSDEVTASYPVFNIRDQHFLLKYMINLENGLVYRDDLAYGKTPLSIRHHPVLKQLKLFNLDTCFMSPAQSMFVIDRPPIRLRFYKTGDVYQIQRAMDNGQGKVAWYQLCALSELQRAYLNLPANDSILTLKPDLPNVINERDTLAWVHTDDQDVLLTDAKQQPWFTAKRIQQETVFNHIQSQGTLIAQNTWLHQTLSTIEDERFIYATTHNNHHTIQLARYGLTFHVPQSAQNLHLDWNNNLYQHQDHRYPLGIGIRSLTFAHGDQEICILPVHEFLATHNRQKNSEYHLLQQDVQATIPAKIVKNYIGKNKPQLWQYSNSERFMVLRLKRGKPLAQTPAEALYLCYLYLGSNQPEKAWDTLEDCDTRLGGFTGSFDEMRYLSWICHRLPRVLDDKDEKATLSPPPVVACQLKALSLFTTFSDLNKSIEFPSIVSDPTSVNGIYEQHIIDETRGFYQNINHEIYILYSRLQAMRREMPIKFTLNDTECSQLLNYYHDHLPEPKDGQRKAVGALAFERVQLHLKMLRKELSALNRIQLTRTLTSFEQQRQQDIIAFTNEHEGIARKYSELEYSSIDLNLPLFPTIDHSFLSNRTREKLSYPAKPLKNIKTNPGSIPAILDTLTPNMKEDVFFDQFPNYLSIATSGDRTAREQIKLFCKATLLAQRHTPLEKQTSNIPLLCNALYRVICSSRVLPDGIDDYDDLLMHVKNMKPASIVVAQLVDKTDLLMIKTQEMWQALPETPLKVLPQTTPGKITHIPLFTGVVPIQPEIFSRWRLLATTFYTGLEDEQVITSCNGTHELSFGQARYNALQQLKQLATNHLNNSKIRDQLDHISNRNSRF